MGILKILLILLCYPVYLVRAQGGEGIDRAIRYKLLENVPDLQNRLNNLASVQGELGFGNQTQMARFSISRIDTRINSMVRSLFDPEIPKEFLYENVSETCVSHTDILLQQLSTETEFPDNWALQMVDAWGKLPSGILRGHTQIPGDFHECLQIREVLPTKEVMRGRYCSTYLLPGEKFGQWMNESALNNLLILQGTQSASTTSAATVEEFLELLQLQKPVTMFPFIGTCFPISCSPTDVQQLLSNFYKWETDDLLTQTVVQCYLPDKPPLDAGDYVVIAVLLAILLLCLSATALDVLSPSQQNSPGVAKKALLSFSLYTNTKKWMSTQVGSDNLGCLHGLRFLSISWIILGHTLFIGTFQLTWNLVDVKQMYQDWSMYLIMNGALAVDTFFTMGGALVAYNLLREFDKRKGKINYPLLILHRYLRLTPTYVILVGVMATLLPYFGSGPMWLILDLDSEWCANGWWHNILYVSNLVPYKAPNAMCYGESWYLSVDMQFFILAPLVIYPLWRWKKIGFGILACLHVASMAIPSAITRSKQLPPASVQFIDMKTYDTDMYIKPWNRFGPYVVGICLGYGLYLLKKRGSFQLNLPAWTIALGWALSTAGALGIIFGPMSFFDPKNAATTYDSWEAALFAGVHRWLWGVITAWIIFACVTGNGGIVNQILSLNIFMPLGRLTYCLYITSWHIQMIYHLGITHPAEFSKFNLTYIFFAHITVSGLVAFILTLTLESPFIQLEKILFTPSPTTPPQKIIGGTEGHIQQNGSNGLPIEEQLQGENSNKSPENMVEVKVVNLSSAQTRRR